MLGSLDGLLGVLIGYATRRCGALVEGREAIPGMFYLHKILPIFLLPVGVTLLLVLAGVWLRRRALIWTGLAVLWLSSTPIVSALAVRAAEGWAERGQAADASEADVIVVLSGDLPGFGRCLRSVRGRIRNRSGATRFDCSDVRSRAHARTHRWRCPP